MKSLIILTTLGCISGCVTIRSASVSNLDPSAAGSRVVAVSEGSGILHITIPDTGFLEAKALAKLKANGVTKNISSRLTMRDFFGIVQIYEFRVEGEK